MMASVVKPPKEHWSVDKKIPAALVLAMLGQIMGFGWYASKVDSRVEDLEKRTVRTETQIHNMDRDVRGFDSRMGRLEEKISAVLDIAKRLEGIIDRRNGNGDRFPERP
jgi:hypothetical protein